MGGTPVRRRGKQGVQWSGSQVETGSVPAGSEAAGAKLGLYFFPLDIKHR